MLVQIEYDTREQALEAAREARRWRGFIRAIVGTRPGGYTLSVALTYQNE